MTSSQQILDDLATHLRITTGVTIPVNLKGHFSLSVPPNRRTRRDPAAQGDLGEEVVLGPCATALGLWLVAARAERVVR